MTVRSHKLKNDLGVYSFLKIIILLLIYISNFLQAQQITVNVSTQFNASPYISDWASDPTLAQLEIISFTETELQVFLQVEFIGDNFGLVLSGESAILDIPGGENIEIIQSTEMIDWSNSQKFVEETNRIETKAANHRNKGRIFIWKRNWDGAIYELQKAKKLDDANNDVYLLLATAYRGKGGVSKSIENLEILNKRMNGKKMNEAIEYLKKMTE